jgi:glycosyltransferase involved in cell wall biosynthesis
MLKNSEPLVSVIMNCYNGEKYLTEAINSVMRQTYSNWELIFWDNVSTDKSKDIFYSFHDSRLKYKLSDKHTNLSEARIRAIKESQGELIAFLDVDDFWKNEKLEKQVSLFEDKDIIFSCTSCNVIYENSNKKLQIEPPRSFTGLVFNELFENYFVVLSSLVVRRNAYDAIGGFSNLYHIIGDFDLVLKLAVTGRCAIEYDYLTYIRKHSNNESDIKSSLYSQEVLDWEIRNSELINKANPSSKDKLIKNLEYCYIINDIKNKKVNFKTIRMCVKQKPLNILKAVYQFIKFYS